ncbi:MAG: DMT family transporter [Lautropia sp.]
MSDPRHTRAVLTMVLCTLLWSSAGVVTRHLDAAGGFELTFWRSLACALFILALLVASRGRDWWRAIADTGRAGLLCGLMWAIMFTCFMVALTITTVAKTLVVLSVAPLVAALLAWVVLGERIAPRTWAAIVLAGAGIVWMVADGLRSDDGRGSSLVGMLVASGVPLAAAINLVAMKKMRSSVDLVPAVFIGATLSCIAMLPLIFPLQASGRDLLLLGGLGVFQLGLPCAMMIRATRWLTPQETALLALLEVVFGPLWAWLGAGEVPAPATLAGGALILVALLANQLLADRRILQRA